MITAGMEPEISELFSDLNKWTRTNRYTPNGDEVTMLSDCTRRVRKYAAGGLTAGGLICWGGLNVIQHRVPMNQMQRIIWTLSGGLIGMGMATSVAGTHAMKQLVAMPNSPIADVARKLIIQRKLKFPDADMYISLFPPESNGWGDAEEAPAEDRTEGKSQVSQRAAERRGVQTGAGGEESWKHEDGASSLLGQQASPPGRGGGWTVGAGSEGNWLHGLANESHARRMAALGRSKSE